MQDRFLRFDGAVNLRDMGGYETTDGRRVREGVVYRSGTLANLRERGVVQLMALGVREVWDLRSAEEVTKHPDRLPEKVVYKNRPMSNPSRTFRFRALASILLRRPNYLRKLLLEGYTDIILMQNATTIGDFCEATAQTTPILLHCTAGKDRTGIFIALLLDLLGVPRSTIVADYELSNEYYPSFVKGLGDELAKLRRFRVDERHVRPLLAVEGETLRQVFAFIDREFGSTERYLMERARVSAETIATLRTLLLEPVTQATG